MKVLQYQDLTKIQRIHVNAQIRRYERKKIEADIIREYDELGIHIRPDDLGNMIATPSDEFIAERAGPIGKKIMKMPKHLTDSDIAKKLAEQKFGEVDARSARKIRIQLLQLFCDLRAKYSKEAIEKLVTRLVGTDEIPDYCKEYSLVFMVSKYSSDVFICEDPQAS